MESQICNSRIFPVSTRLYIPLHQSMCVEIARVTVQVCEGDMGKIRTVRHRRAAASVLPVRYAVDAALVDSSHFK